MRTLSALILTALLLLPCHLAAQEQSLPLDLHLPTPTTDSQPGSRWWWMGSAVDTANLSYCIDEYARAGLGTLEITPIYGVQGEDEHELPFLSERWLAMYRHACQQAARHNMRIDMMCGTGWPFGGPTVGEADAACKLVVAEKTDGSSNSCSLPLLTTGKTRQKVKRAAPGGEGYVIDHFSKAAVSNYLQRFTDAFTAANATGSETLTPVPSYFFNDSYEVYQADWTANLLSEFQQRRGYRLEDHAAAFLTADSAATPDIGGSTLHRRLVADYRETLSDMLLENFTQQWTAWAHTLGSATRSQAHGSPGNLIDLYAAVDIPECESFGLSDFGIAGLRRDSLTSPKYYALSMLKYAKSDAQNTGEPFASSEALTWLTEHFRTSLSQCKPDIDLMFVAGVNRIFFHGTTYSPRDTVAADGTHSNPWPGWKFYASVDMSPTNAFWRDAPTLFSYITRCQTYLQYGAADNDVLLYLPVYDLWDEVSGRLLMFDIHKMGERAPRFIQAVNDICAAGYDTDYISDRQLLRTSVSHGKITTAGGASYKAIIIPAARLMPLPTLQKLAELAANGAAVIFLNSYPIDVPGAHNLAERREQMQALLAKGRQAQRGGRFRLVASIRQAADRLGPSERGLRQLGLSYIRRRNDDGHHYFISALTSHDTASWVPLGVRAQSALIVNPMTGHCGKATLRNNNGTTEIYLQLRSGESTIVKTYATANITANTYIYYSAEGESQTLDGDWGFDLVASEPQIAHAPEAAPLGSWTDLAGYNLKDIMATVRYTKHVTLHDPTLDNDHNSPQGTTCNGLYCTHQRPGYLLQLGDVRESARVTVNGHAVATLVALPFEVEIGQWLHNGDNVIEVEVTNLPANRIAALDREGVAWRKFKEINIVDLNYKKQTYAHWQPMASGLLGPVTLTRLTAVNP